MAKTGKEDIDFQIQFYEGILKKQCDFVQALIVLGDLYTKKGLYEKGLEIDKRLLLLRPEDPLVLYNLACSYSLLRNVEKAFSVMKKAIEYGYNDFRFLKQDPDLKNLLKDSTFCQYLSQLKK